MLFIPEWPAPVNVKAAITLREGGYSQHAWQGFNLATHVGDNPEHVQANRQYLISELNSVLGSVPAHIQWLNQIHGVHCEALSSPFEGVLTADAARTQAYQLACCVMTADCLPLLICDKHGREVAAVHAGWKGLANGIVTRCVEQFHSKADALLVYLGPAISQPAFQVGAEVREAFIQSFKERGLNCDEAEAGFVVDPAANDERYLADLYALARAELKAIGVRDIYGGDACTYRERERYYSYRRDGVCGRMASLIWLDHP